MSNNPILELKLIGFDSLDVMLVDGEIKQVETMTASNPVLIFCCLESKLTKY
jgi:hypothetical protein